MEVRGHLECLRQEEAIVKNSNLSVGLFEYEDGAIRLVGRSSDPNLAELVRDQIAHTCERNDDVASPSADPSGEPPTPHPAA